MIKFHFHLGQPKTGSSSIQRVLKNNIEELKKQGYLYSTNGIDHQDTLLKIKKREEFKTFIENQINEAIRFNCKNIIISDEALFFKNNDILSEWLESIDENYYAYIYLKRQDIYLESSWKQWHFKNQNYIDFNDYLKKYKVENYFYHLSKWMNYIKKENMQIIAFEQRNFKNGLVENFFQMLGIKNLKNFNFNVQDDGWGENKGLTDEGLKFAFEVREFADNNIHNHTIQNFMSKYFISFQKEHFENYKLISYKKRIQLIKENDIINDKISKEVLNVKDKLFQDSIDINQDISTDIASDRIIKVLMTIGIKQDIMIKDMGEEIKKIKQFIYNKEIK